MYEKLRLKFILCLDVREHATKIINYEKKEMIPLTKEEKKMPRRQKKNAIFEKKDLVLIITIKIP